MSYKLLDCTLRDGGYVNEWNFGKDAITNIFERLVASGVDVIEVGFLDQRHPFSEDFTIMPNTDCVQKIFGRLERKNAMVVGMIDYGTCDIVNLKPRKDCYLDGIRVIFKKQIMHEAFDYIAQVIALGYDVFAQAVSITSYSDKELIEFIEIANKVKPYAVSIVDTYGLLHQRGLLHVAQIMDNNLDPKIVLGYHAHNNFQMGYANAIAFLEQKVHRDILVDGTLYGFGKSAGNAPLELLGMYMNENCEKHYDINQMLEAIQTSVMDVYRKTPWGYNLFFYVAALNKCHPSYVSFLMNKRTLSITAINEILQKIVENKKLLYDVKYIEQLYFDYQGHYCDDKDALQKLGQNLLGKSILAIGPGKSIVTESELISEFIGKKKPTIIAINYLPKGIQPDYIFLTNAQRYVQLTTKLSYPENKKIQIISTSNITKVEGYESFVLDYASLVDEKAEFPDNSLHMLVRLLIKIGIKIVNLAGFDGYTPDNMNYMDNSMEYSFVREKANNLNFVGRSFFANHSTKIEAHFITRSLYVENDLEEVACNKK